MPVIRTIAKLNNLLKDNLVCREYAQNNDILIVDTYIDHAMTGTNDMRPDFQRMLKDSAKRQWKIVLV